MATTQLSRESRRVAVAIVAAGMLVASTARAAVLEAKVTTPSGAPLADAVVAATPVLGAPAPKAQELTAIIDQIGEEFVPHVKAVRVGASVHFPNKDNIRHQVYSLSRAKRFELPLYRGKPANPVVFDKPGVVALGCNIHDWMVGYVYVLETPYFAVTGAEGTAQFADLPAGDYELCVYHPRAKAPDVPECRRVAAGVPPEIFSFKVRPDIRKPHVHMGDY